mmetsp:Transcript_55802/g.181191  ORF Transcript_55802/g.181191 Transcript_55802/m.181191 type:complete len:205 (+) Transcript_55802:233-847(+)
MLQLTGSLPQRSHLGSHILHHGGLLLGLDVPKPPLASKGGAVAEPGRGLGQGHEGQLELAMAVVRRVCLDADLQAVKDVDGDALVGRERPAVGRLRLLEHKPIHRAQFHNTFGPVLLHGHGEPRLRDPHDDADGGNGPLLFEEQKSVELIGGTICPACHPVSVIQLFQLRRQIRLVGHALWQVLQLQGGHEATMYQDVSVAPNG